MARGKAGPRHGAAHGGGCREIERGDGAVHLRIRLNEARLGERTARIDRPTRGECCQGLSDETEEKCQDNTG